MTEIRALMVGRIVEVLVEIGATVQADEEVMIIESMKMEIPVVTPVTGTIEALHVSAGDTIEEQALLVTLAES